jgi:hypothetical protein
LLATATFGRAAFSLGTGALVIIIFIGLAVVQRIQLGAKVLRVRIRPCGLILGVFDPVGARSVQVQ